MFRGTVKLRARIKGEGVQFDACEFNTNIRGVDTITVASQEGREIIATVCFAEVATEADGKSVANTITSVALDRLSFRYNIAIDDAEITGSQFSERSPSAGSGHLVEPSAPVLARGPITAIVGIPPERIRTELERRDAPGQLYYGLFRSAKQSHGPVEEFMHLYNLLLMLFEDKQSEVDAFLLSQDPTIPQTPDPRPHVHRMETVYTRLRNEFGYHRTGVNLSHTKMEMAERVGDLSALVQKAIER